MSFRSRLTVLVGHRRQNHGPCVITKCMSLKRIGGKNQRLHHRLMMETLTVGKPERQLEFLTQWWHRPANTRPKREFFGSRVECDTTSHQSSYALAIQRIDVACPVGVFIGVDTKNWAVFDRHQRHVFTGRNRNRSSSDRAW